MDLKNAANIKHSGSEWLLCLHGLQSNKELFDEFLSEPFLSQYSLLVPDFIGFGASPKPIDFSYDVQEQAYIIEKLVKQLSIQKLNIVGHSLGGMVAILLLNPLKDIINSFVNMEGNLVLSDCGPSKEIATYSFDTFKNTKYDEIKSDIKNSKRAQWLAQTPDFVFYKTSQSIVAWSSSGKLLDEFQNASCRKLFIYGSENSKKAASLKPGIELAEIPKSGHFMLQDNPEACFKTIKQFL
jgi:pimeloyl-ACP methyl ester carboxylesterase